MNSSKLFVSLCGEFSCTDGDGDGAIKFAISSFQLQISCYENGIQTDLLILHDFLELQHHIMSRHLAHHLHFLDEQLNIIAAL